MREILERVLLQIESGLEKKFGKVNCKIACVFKVLLCVKVSYQA